MFAEPLALHPHGERTLAVIVVVNPLPFVVNVTVRVEAPLVIAPFEIVHEYVDPVPLSGTEAVIDVLGSAVVWLGVTVTGHDG
jgi:hypothetical protein